MHTHLVYIRWTSSAHADIDRLLHRHRHRCTVTTTTTTTTISSTTITTSCSQACMHAGRHCMTYICALQHVASLTGVHTIGLLHAGISHHSKVRHLQKTSLTPFGSQSSPTAHPHGVCLALPLHHHNPHPGRPNTSAASTHLSIYAETNEALASF